MVDKKIIEEFLGTLLKTINKTNLYQSSHPLFLEAVEEFRQSVGRTLGAIDPLIIGVTIKSLIVENEVFTEPEFQKLAKKLHLQRVKKIEISSGVTKEELFIFFDRLNLPVKEVSKAGGLPNILSKEIMTHLLIQKLDYSELLTEATGEYKDIWFFLLGETIAAHDHAGTLKLANDFGKMISYFPVEEILEDDQIRENIRGFLGYLKKSDKEKFSQCLKEIAQHIFRDVNAP
jgi:hypothetical protein